MLAGDPLPAGGGWGWLLLLTLLLRDPRPGLALELELVPLRACPLPGKAGVSSLEAVEVTGLQAWAHLPWVRMGEAWVPGAAETALSRLSCVLLGLELRRDLRPELTGLCFGNFGVKGSSQ